MVNAANVKRKAGLLLSLLLMTGGLGGLAGCEKASEDVTETPATTVTIWTWDETFNVKAAKMAAEEYSAEHENIEFNVVTKEREEILVDVKNMLAAELYDELPDLILIEDYDIQAVLATYADEFTDLTKELDYSKFADYKTNLCYYGGSLYGIPFDSGTAALFYRLDYIEAAGYTEEDMQDLTWEEYFEIGEQVRNKTGHAMLTVDPTDLPLMRIVLQSYGRWYVTADGRMADIEGNEALKYGIGLYERLLTSETGKSVIGWNEFISAFQTGEVASVISGGWIISSLKVAGDQSGLWRVAAIPVEPDSGAVAASNVGGNCWYILKHAKASEEAKKFAVEMFAENDAFMDRLIEEIGILPAVKDATIYENYEAGDPFFGGQQVTRFLTDIESSIPAVNYGSKTYEIEEILCEELQNILNGSDVDQCLSTVQQKADAIIR